MTKLIGIYLSWVIIFAFVNAKKNNVSFFEEVKSLLHKNFLFVKNLLLKLLEKKESQEEKEGDIAAKMYSDAMKLNSYVEAMVNYKFVGNHGWEYETLNFMYCITHNLPVIIKIRVFNNMIVRAKVITCEMKVLDIVAMKSGKDTAAAKIFNFEMPDTESPIESVAASASEDTIPMGSDSGLSSAENTKDAEEKPSSSEAINEKADAPDEAKVKIIVENYLVDNYNQLEILANEAIANNSDSFYFTPDLEGEVLLSCMATLIVEKLQYKKAAVEGENIHIYVNLESPADDGNYDFETNEPALDAPKKDKSEITPDGEELVKEDIDDIPEELIPEEPEDIPQ